MLTSISPQHCRGNLDLEESAKHIVRSPIIEQALASVVLLLSIPPACPASSTGLDFASLIVVIVQQVRLKADTGVSGVICASWSRHCVHVGFFT